MTDRIPIAYVRARDREAPEATWTYLAVREADLRGMLAQSDGVMTLTQCHLDLPALVADMTAAQLATPMQRATVIIGTAVDGTWVTGPLAGEEAP